MWLRIRRDIRCKIGFCGLNETADLENLGEYEATFEAALANLSVA
jgi:hypothetical protein